MTRSRPITVLATAAVIPLAALAVAACGGSAAATASPPPPAAASKSTTAPSKTTTAKTATLRIANSRLGRILVDSTGHTLYLFKADSATSSACSGACSVAWPPLLTGASPAVAGGANRALVGTIARSDGARQVTYNGHPLYTFVKDHRPGDVTGQGVTAFGAAWFAVAPAGSQIPKPPDGARHRFIVVASGATRRTAGCKSPTGAEASAQARSEARTEAGAACCEAGAASQQRHPPKWWR